MKLRSKLKRIVKGMILLIKEKNIVSIPQPVNTNNLLEGKVALITGGSSGIGFAIAESFLNNGAYVILAGRKENILQECCKKLGRSCKYLVLDVTDIESIPGKVRDATALYDGKLDILVNSAGLVAKSKFIDMFEAEYDAIMDTNVKGTFFMSQAVGKYMIENNIKGHILNISSSSALRPAWTAYEMSKWAVRGFTEGLADTLLPYGIIVNAIGPGPTATPMLGKKTEENLYNEKSIAKRFILPSEIANLAVFMVSDMANMVVGDTFYITGGSGIISLHH